MKIINEIPRRAPKVKTKDDCRVLFWDIIHELLKKHHGVLQEAHHQYDALEPIGFFITGTIMFKFNILEDVTDFLKDLDKISNMDLGQLIIDVMDAVIKFNDHDFLLILDFGSV